MSSFILTMSSDEYGAEEFTYPSRRGLLRGLNRLLREIESQHDETERTLEASICGLRVEALEDQSGAIEFEGAVRSFGSLEVCRMFVRRIMEIGYMP